jgi:hypothetical protein
MVSSSTDLAARKLRRRLRGASLQLASAIALLGVALFSACSQSGAAFLADNEASSDVTRGAGTGGWSGSGSINIESAAASAGAGGEAKPPSYANGSYSYLCGGSNAECMPGTGDCTPGGNPNMNPDAGATGSVRACQLIAENGKVTAQCVEAGTFNAGDACENAAHCSATLGCVNTMSGGTSGGICRPYCCDDVELCPRDSYCAPLRMAEAALKIPVCTPVKKCKVLDDSTCDNGQVCTIVRNDGTTSCVDPGTGTRDEACPCASGHVCSKITNTCRKLCHLGNDATDCEGGGTCQGGVMGYPEGIGTCTGY